MCVQEIIDQINNKELTAYRISKETNLSEDGINKILSGKSKNPRKTTIQILSEYLSSDKENEQLNNKAEILLGLSINKLNREDIIGLKMKINKMDDKFDLLITEVEKLIKTIHSSTQT